MKSMLIRLNYEDSEFHCGSRERAMDTQPYNNTLTKKRGISLKMEDYLEKYTGM